MSSVITGCLARTVGVTLQTAFAIKCGLFLYRRRAMRIVTRDAAERAIAFLVATAGPHLLHMAHGARATVFRHSMIDIQRRPDIFKRLTRTKVEIALSVPCQSNGRLQVTLIADRFPPDLVQLRRVDDRIRS